MLILFNFYANYRNIVQKVQKDSDFKDTFLEKQTFVFLRNSKKI